MYSTPRGRYSAVQWFLWVGGTTGDAWQPSLTIVSTGQCHLPPYHTHIPWPGQPPAQAWTSRAAQGTPQDREFFEICNFPNIGCWLIRGHREGHWAPGNDRWRALTTALNLVNPSRTCHAAAIFKILEILGAPWAAHLVRDWLAAGTDHRTRAGYGGKMSLYSRYNGQR